MARLAGFASIVPLLLIFPSGPVAPEDPKAVLVDQIEAVVADLGYNRADAPGLSLMVVHEGKILFQRGYGLADVEAGIPNTVDTNFRLASVSKQFTAMAILMLVEQGKLRLDSRLTDLLPGLPDYARAITVSQLLGHTSGLPEAFDLAPADRDEQLQDADLLEILRRQTQAEFPPGSQFQYSNTGYVMLGLIVEQVAGETFPAFLKRNIFDPLGMRGTVMHEAGGPPIRHRAYGYTPTDNGFQRTDQNRTSATRGDGGIYSSVDDLFLWDQALETSRLVGAETLRLAFTPGTCLDGSSTNYGLGWRIDTVGGVRRLGHEGVTIGFRNQVVRLPEKRFTVVVLMNRADGRPARVAHRIAQLFYPGVAAGPEEFPE